MNSSLKINPTASVGFLIGIGAWSITFITLIWGYLFYRLRGGQWLAAYIDETVMARVIAATMCLAASSFLIHAYSRKRSPWILFLGLTAGVVFIALQWGMWGLIMAHGLTWTKSIAGSFLFLLTGFHALHIVIGLGLLLALGLRVIQSSAAAPDGERFLFSVIFWDLLLAFWLVLFVLIFILK